MKLSYYKGFGNRKGYVSVTQSEDDPEYLIFEHEGIIEEMINQHAGIDEGFFVNELNFKEQIQTILKGLWLYTHPRNWRIKQVYDNPEDAWSDNMTPDEKRRVQLNYDHNVAAWKRLNLNKNGRIEDLWISAEEQYIPPKAPPKTDVNLTSSDQM